MAVPVELRVQQGVRLYRQKSDTMQSALVGESLVLELISTGAPLTQVLDKLCIALNVQVGNVVSLVLSTDDAEHSEHAIAQSAAQLGLSLFSCTAILSLSEELLGTFEMYSCSPRTPTPGECRLIERATQLAALAIQRHYHEHDSGSWSTDWSGAIGKSSRERPPSKN